MRHPSPTHYDKVLTKLPAKTFSTLSTQTDVLNIVQTDRNDVRLTDVHDSAQTLTDSRQDSH